MKAGDRITVKLDFAEKILEYFYNKKLIGYFSDIKMGPKELVYPAVGLASGCEISFDLQK